MKTNVVLQGNCLDVLKTLPDESVNCCITSPPYYGLRDYGTGTWIGGDPNCKHLRKSKLAPNANTGHKRMAVENSAVGDGIYKSVCKDCGAIREDLQVGLEETPEQYIARLVDIFNEVKRVLTKDGTCWVNIGDTYNVSSYVKNEYSTKMHDKQASNRGSYENGVERPRAENCKPKDLIGIPWMLAFAMRESGWYLRQDIIWAKPNPMPESVKDRCVKSHEYIFLFSKSPKYYFDYKAIQEERVTDYKITPPQRTVSGESKYMSISQETSVRQGMNRNRGNNIVELRKSLPPQDEFVAFIRQRTSVDELFNKTKISKTKIEHWFRKDNDGFAYPSVEDWKLIRDILNDSSELFTVIDNQMTDVTLETDSIDKNSNGKRMKRDVWNVIPAHYKWSHFATFPEELVYPMVVAGCPKGGVVLDPFFGSGTTGAVAKSNNRDYIGIELSEEYVDIATKRLQGVGKKLF